MKPCDRWRKHVGTLESAQRDFGLWNRQHPDDAPFDLATLAGIVEMARARLRRCEEGYEAFAREHLGETLP